MTIQSTIKPDFKLWFTLQEFADAAKAGLFCGVPSDKASVWRMAERENWQQYSALVKIEKGRGGTITRYHIDLLPIDVRLAYISRFLRVEADDLRVSGAIDANLTERARTERSARMIAVRLADQFRRLNRLTAVASDHLFTLAFNGRRVEGMPDWVYETVGKVSVRSIMRWRAKAKDGDGAALGVDPAQARKGTGLLETANDGAVRLHILAWITDAPALSAEIIRAQVEYKFGRELVDRNGELKPLPPTRTFQHYIAHLRETEKVAITAINNPDKYRSTMKLVGTGAYRYVTRANQMWMVDASPVDVLCTDGRWSMYACIDVATRRYIITLSRTPRASAVQLLSRKAILLWGTAEVIKTDNGSDFVAVSVKRLFDDLDIVPDTSHAYSPAEKGLVERAIKTFQHEVCPQLPGYIGHNVAERKRIEERKSFAQRLGTDDRELFEVALTAEELQHHIDEWLTYIYHERKHDGLQGLTPNEAGARSAEIIRRVDERALDALLMPVAGKNGIRIYGHQGIKIDHRQYISGKILYGTEVFCRHHPDDMGKIYVYSADGREFLDVATCAEFSGVNPAEFVAAIKAENAALVAERMKDVKAEIRQIKKGPAAIVRSIEVAKRRAAEKAQASANIIQLPKREQAHVTPQIAAALDAAVLPGRMPEARSLNEKAAELHAAITREAENRGKSTVVHLDPDAALSSDARMFKWALAVEGQIASGVVVDDETAVRLTRYQASADYQTRKDIFGDFGLEAALRG